MQRAAIPMLWAAVVQAVRRERGAAHADRVIERSLHGTRVEVERGLAALRSAGVEQLLLAFHDPHDHLALEVFAEAMAEFR